MMMTVKELTDAYKLSINAITTQIRKGRLKATKKKYEGGCGFKWMINKADYEDYRAHRYNRDQSRHNGKLIFDKSKGLYSVAEAAKIVGCDTQQIYYHLRKKVIKHKRVKSHWVMHIDDIKAYQAKVKKFSNKKYKKIKSLKA